MNNNPKTVTILLVEDSKSDARLIKEFLKGTDFNSVLHTVNHGMEAINFLYMHYEYDCPDIVILDLNLPRMSGLEVLKRIKNDSDLRKIPVIILSTSNDQESIDECYKSYANCYIVKPADLNDFEKVVNSIKQWFKIVNLP